MVGYVVYTSWYIDKHTENLRCQQVLEGRVELYKFAPLQYGLHRQYYGNATYHGEGGTIYRVH